MAGFRGIPAFMAFDFVALGGFTSFESHRKPDSNKRFLSCLADAPHAYVWRRPPHCTYDIKDRRCTLSLRLRV